MWRPRKRRSSTDQPSVADPEAGGEAPEEAQPEPAEPVESAEHAGFGELRLDLPGPFAPTWRESLRRKALLVTLSRRAPAVRPSALPILAASWTVIAGLLGAAVLLAVSGVPFSAPGVAVIWLAGNHVPIGTEAGTITLLPLGLLVCALLPARRAGRFVAVQAGERVRTAGMAAIAGYAVAAAAMSVALSLTGSPVTAAWPAAVLWAGAVALAGGAWGLSRQTRGRWRPPTAAVAVGLTVAAPLLLGALLMAGVGLSGLGSIIEGQQRLVASPLEHVGLVVLQLVYLPNLLIWAAAFAIGSGFAIGAGNTLAPFTEGQPVLPDLPVLAALPSDVPTWTALVPLMVAASGAVAAMVLGRGSGEQQLSRRIARIGPIAVGSGVVWALLAMLSAGAVGDARLAHVGPSIGTGVVAAVLVAGGGLLWAVLPSLASESRPRAADLRVRVQSRSGERVPPGSGPRRGGRVRTGSGPSS